MKNTIAKIGKYTNTKGGHIHTILPKNTIAKISDYTNTKIARATVGKWSR